MLIRGIGLTKELDQLSPTKYEYYISQPDYEQGCKRRCKANLQKMCEDKIIKFINKEYKNKCIVRRYYKFLKMPTSIEASDKLLKLQGLENLSCQKRKAAVPDRVKKMNSKKGSDELMAVNLNGLNPQPTEKLQGLENFANQHENAVVPDTVWEVNSKRAVNDLMEANLSGYNPQPTEVGLDESGIGYTEGMYSNYEDNITYLLTTNEFDRDEKMEEESVLIMTNPFLSPCENSEDIEQLLSCALG